MALLSACHCFGQQWGRGKSMAGYYLNDSSTGTMYALKLNTDSTFVYSINAGMMIDTVVGKWSVARNKLLLNPEVSGNYHEKEFCNPCKGETFITVYDEEGGTIELASVEVYEKGLRVKSGFINSLDFSTLSFDSLKIEHLGFQSYSLTPEYGTSWVYRVYLRSDLSEQMEQKRILKIKKSRLITESRLILRKQR